MRCYPSCAAVEQAATPRLEMQRATFMMLLRWWRGGWWTLMHAYEQLQEKCSGAALHPASLAAQAGLMRSSRRGVPR